MSLFLGPRGHEFRVGDVIRQFRLHFTKFLFQLIARGRTCRNEIVALWDKTRSF